MLLLNIVILFLHFNYINPLCCFIIYLHLLKIKYIEFIIRFIVYFMLKRIESKFIVLYEMYNHSYKYLYRYLTSY